MRWYAINAVVFIVVSTMHSYVCLDQGIWFKATNWNEIIQSLRYQSLRYHIQKILFCIVKKKEEPMQLVSCRLWTDITWDLSHTMIIFFTKKQGKKERIQCNINRTRHCCLIVWQLGFQLKIWSVLYTYTSYLWTWSNTGWV